MKAGFELQSVLGELVEPHLAIPKTRKNTLMEKFEDYLEMLRSRGKDNNLTGFRDTTEMVVQVICDALVPLESAPHEIRDGGPRKLIDVGSGAGMPGIVYALYWPDCEVCLLESNKKRLEFLNETVKNLGIENCEVLEGRAETLAHELAYREGFDLVTSRGLAPLPISLELCLPFADKDRWMLTFKGKEPMAEVKDAEVALAKLGGGKVEVKYYAPAPGQAKRSALWIPKVSLTPDKFPRREGIPAKRPLRGNRN